MSQATTAWRLSDANACAEVLLDLPGALSCYLFGSIARDGDGHDIDLIVTVDEQSWKHFCELVLEEHAGWIDTTPSDWYNEPASLRLELAHEVLRYPYQLNALRRPIDIFLFPEDWLSRLDELQAALPHHDPLFMTKIAADALKYDPTTEMFIPRVYSC